MEYFAVGIFIFLVTSIANLLLFLHEKNNEDSVYIYIEQQRIRSFIISVHRHYLRILMCLLWSYNEFMADCNGYVWQTSVLFLYNEIAVYYR